MEFALVVPLVLLLLVGMIDFGRAFTYWIDETHLANEAARFAAVNKVPGSCTAPCASIEGYVHAQARAPERRVRVYLLEGTIPADKGKVGEALCVYIEAGTKLSAGVPVYEFLPFLNVGAAKTLEAKSVMRIEKAYKGDGTDAYTDASTLGPVPTECT